MKKRTGIIGVLIAILVLGIGYAAISGVTLNITGTGTISPDDANFKVHYDTSVTPTTTLATGTTTGATATAAYTDELNGTLTVSGFTKKDDSATATYTIINESEDINATLATPTIGTYNTEYFTVSSSVASTSLAYGGATTTQTVTVTAIKTPTDADKTTAINVTLNATPAE